MIRSLVFTLAAVLLAGAAMLPTVDVAAAQCVHTVTVDVERGLPMARVEAIARREWQSVVSRTYGVNYSSWRHAQAASTRCVQTETRSNGERPYLCFARGIPCKAGE